MESLAQHAQTSVLPKELDELKPNYHLRDVIKEHQGTKLQISTFLLITCTRSSQTYFLHVPSLDSLSEALSFTI